MILGHHIILTGYGHWLPNDPRGSLSLHFRNPELRALGEIHFGRQNKQPDTAAIREFYQQARKYLTHDPLWFGDPEISVIGCKFREMIEGERLTCYACAILRNHVHLLMRTHKIKGHVMSKMFKDASQDAVRRHVSLASHPIWSENDFVAFKDHPKTMRTALNYVLANLQKHRMSPQEWDFISPLKL